MKIFKILGLVLPSFLFSQIEIVQQYNGFAEKYSEIVVENNQDSCSAYYWHFNFSLAGKNLLDLGCGNGFDLNYFQSKGAIIHGIDSSQKMIQIAQKKLPEAKFIHSNFDRIDFADAAMDVVVSKWAFQTVSLIDPIYNEIARVLKPGGRFVFLASHPIRQFIEKKRKGKDYFMKEIVESSFFDGQVTVYEPSHTLNEYLSPTFFQYFELEAYEEGFDSGAEMVDGDKFPSFFILKAIRR